MTNDVAILDFGSSKITVLVGQQGMNNTLVINGKGESEYAGFCDGEFFRPDQLGQAVGHAITVAETTAKMKITKIYIGVPGDFTICVCKETRLNFNSPKHKISDADVSELHEQGNTFDRDPAVKLINIQPVYYVLSDERRLIDPVGLQSAKLSGLISYLLAENYFIRTVDEIVKGLGINEVEYISDVLAESLFLFDDIKRDKGALLIDVGYITTNVAVVKGDGLLALHSFSLGGGNITGDLANYFRISFAEAEALKRKVTLSLFAEPDDCYEVSDRYPVQLVNDLVDARIGVIAKTIQKCIKMCPYDLPENITYSLTGGGISYIRGAKEALAERLRKPVEIVAPKIPQMEVPAWSSSLGLMDLVLNIQTPHKKSFFAKLFKK